MLVNDWLRFFLFLLSAIQNDLWNQSLVAYFANNNSFYRISPCHWFHLRRKEEAEPTNCTNKLNSAYAASMHISQSLTHRVWSNKNKIKNQSISADCQIQRICLALISYPIMFLLSSYMESYANISKLIFCLDRARILRMKT